jgi:hypothetical protein
VADRQGLGEVGDRSFRHGQRRELNCLSASLDLLSCHPPFQVRQGIHKSRIRLRGSKCHAKWGWRATDARLRG